MNTAIVKLPDWEHPTLHGSAIDPVNVVHVVITGAEQIPDDAFAGFKNLRSVDISDEVTGVGNGAFERLKSLETVHFGKSIKRIGKGAFYGCENIEELVIPGNVVSIEEDAFGRMHGLRRLTIEEGVEELGFMIFDECENLAEVHLPLNSVKHIGGLMFDKSKWLKRNKEEFITACGILVKYNGKKKDIVIMPDTIKAISHWAFCYCDFKEIVIGKGIKQIPNLAFLGCKALEKVVIPEGVEEIGIDAFKDCTNLKSVEIPMSIKKVGANSLKPALVANGSKKGCVYAGRAVIGCVGDSKKLEIKEGTYSISPGAFDDAYKVETIILPNTIREIDCSFLACKHLSSVVIPRDVPAACLNNFEHINGIKMYVWAGSEAEQFAKEKGSAYELWNENVSYDELIKKATNRKKSKIIIDYDKQSPSKWFRRTGNALAGITSIGKKTIHDEQVKVLSLPIEIDGVRIERLVFDCLTFLRDVPEIEELVIPAGLTIQGITTTEGRDCYDFPNSETIKHLVFTGKTEINFYRYCGRFDDSIEAITIQGSDRFVTIDGVVYSKDGSALVFYPRSKKDKKFIVPDYVTTIWGDSFQNVRYLEELVLPEGLKTIHNEAFRNSSIKKIFNPSQESCDTEGIEIIPV